MWIPRIVKRLNPTVLLLICFTKSPHLHPNSPPEEDHPITDE